MALERRKNPWSLLIRYFGLPRNNLQKFGIVLCTAELLVQYIVVQRGPIQELWAQNGLTNIFWHQTSWRVWIVLVATIPKQTERDQKGVDKKMSCFKCQVSHVTCHVSGVTCRVLYNLKFERNFTSRQHVCIIAVWNAIQYMIRLKPSHSGEAKMCNFRVGSHL